MGLLDPDHSELAEQDQRGDHLGSCLVGVHRVKFEESQVHGASGGERRHESNSMTIIFVRTSRSLGTGCRGWLRDHRPFNAPSQGPPPWQVYRVEPTRSAS